MTSPYDRPELAELWRLAVETMESGRSAFSIRITDAETAQALGSVLRKHIDHPARRQISLVKLDEHLRQGPFGASLVEVLAAVHGRTVDQPAGQLEWRSRWLAQVRRYDGVPEADFAALIAKADTVLSHMVGRNPRDLVGDDVRLTRVVLRAAALAHGVPLPETPAAERALWERCGSTLDKRRCESTTRSTPFEEGHA